jgi:cob(I)alamin adenosyltransferase
MAVHLTRIYTKTGDDGTTALGDMSRVSKTDPRVEAYADVNEANAALGVALALGGLDARSPRCCGRCRTTCSTSAPTCAPRWCRTRSGRRSGSRPTTRPGWSPPATGGTPGSASWTASSCPGGTAGSALLQVALTVVRRAERRTWALVAAEPDRTGKEPALYLNRLSDLLFILSRVANPDGDVLWVRGAGRVEQPVGASDPS